MQEGILVVGAGGHGKSVLSMLLADGAPVAGILDDDASLATVGHDAVLGAFAQLAPGVQAGGARIGRGAILGLGSVVCPCVTLGEGATLGAGAVAVRDIPAGATAFGVPTRPRPT